MALDMEHDPATAPVPSKPLGNASGMRSAMTAEGLTNIPAVQPLQPAPVGGSILYDAGVVLGAAASGFAEVFGGIFGSDKNKKEPDTTVASKQRATPVPGTAGTSPFNL